MNMIPAYRSSIGLFDVDTRELSEDGTSIRFRKRVKPISHQLQMLFEFGDDKLTLSTTCLQSKTIPPDSTGNYGLLQMKGEVDWENDLSKYRQLFIERRSLDCPKENRCQCVFDAFKWNPNISKVVAAAGIQRWCVFGVSLEYCLSAAVNGLLDTGQGVVVIEDALITNTDDQALIQQVFAGFKSKGAEISSTSTFLETYA